MNKIMALCAAALFVFVSTSAQARSHHHRHNTASAGSFHIDCDHQGCHKIFADRHRARPFTVQGEVTITITKRKHGVSAAVRDANENRVERAIGSGVIRSHKTGATAHVSSRAAPAMQAMLDDLEHNHGATIRFVGGIRAGRCSLGSQHPCGWAMDVCQLSRGVVDPRCNLPAPAEFHRIARAHGLYEGAVWCNTDYGHVQFKDSGGCNIAAHGRGGVKLATLTGKMVNVQDNSARRHRHHRRIHIARR